MKVTFLFPLIWEIRGESNDCLFSMLKALVDKHNLRVLTFIFIMTHIFGQFWQHPQITSASVRGVGVYDNPYKI